MKLFWQQLCMMKYFLFLYYCYSWMKTYSEVWFGRMFLLGSLGRVLLLVTKKFTYSVFINSNFISKLFGTPTAAGWAMSNEQCSVYNLQFWRIVSSVWGIKSNFKSNIQNLTSKIIQIPNPKSQIPNLIFFPPLWLFQKVCWSALNFIQVSSPRQSFRRFSGALKKNYTRCKY